MLPVIVAGGLHHGVQERAVPGRVQLTQPHLQLLACVDTWGWMHATNSAYLTCSIGLHCADLPIPVQWASWHLGCKWWDFGSHHFVLLILVFSSILSILASLFSLFFILPFPFFASLLPFVSHLLSPCCLLVPQLHISQVKLAHNILQYLFNVSLCLSVSVFASPSLCMSACEYRWIRMRSFESFNCFCPSSLTVWCYVNLKLR